MKYTLALIALVSLSIGNAHSHPGGLDKKGGHVDAKTGKYHTHKTPAKKDDAKKAAAKKK